VSEEEQQAAVAEGTEIVTRSSSQMSFTSRIENFDALIRLLETIPEYTPNETDLTLVGDFGLTMPPFSVETMPL
jgi:hypothetical protein